MFVRLLSFGLSGIECFPVDVELDISGGQMPAFDIVGLPDIAVKESRDRVRSALKNSKLSFPAAKITVNLSPANIRKLGAAYDLPILMALLEATGQISLSSGTCAFMGELSLSGELKPVAGILPMVIKAREMGLEKIFIPHGNAREASVINGIDIIAAKSVEEMLEHFNGSRIINPVPEFAFQGEIEKYMLDFSDVKGQVAAKRALEIAAAGGHNILLVGPPGSGKSMLAKRLPTILPQMTQREKIETTMIYSVCGMLSNEHPLVIRRPFRSPHHTVSPAGLSGGGSTPRPGEISLAHNGVLFLDELPEFNKQAMEILRQPLEDGTVTISRATGSLTYPCFVMLVAAMNPCPCGYFGHPTKKCSCSSQAVSRYVSKISGPLLDRIDLHIEVAPVDFQDLSKKAESEDSAQIRKRVETTRDIQKARFQALNKDNPVRCNAEIPSSMMSSVCELTPAASKILKTAFDKLGLSARAYDRILKVSRTIADLDLSEKIEEQHITESIGYRSLDRKYFSK